MAETSSSAERHRADGALIASIPTATMIVGHLTNPDVIDIPAHVFYLLVAYLTMTIAFYAWSRTKQSDLEQT